MEGGTFDLDGIIDLYGATIVVPTFDDIEQVVSAVSLKFNIHRKIEHREKAPQMFIYDDLHLYISFKPSTPLPDGMEYLIRKFELQLKTFLQYSWHKATHDLLYKGKDVSWPRFRVAYQTKAMLEQADQILTQIDKTADICPENEFRKFVNINSIISIIENTWSPEQLPHDMRRLAINILNLLMTGNKKITFLKHELEETTNRDLISAKSVTPHQAVLGILIRRDPNNLIKGLKSARKSILITKELREILGNIPEDLDALSLKFNSAIA